MENYLRQVWHRLRGLWPEIQSFVAAGLAVLTGNWAAAEAKDCFDLYFKEAAHPDVRWWSFALSISLFWACVYWLFHLRKTWTHPRSRLPKDDRHPPKRERLLLFLSNLDPSRGSFVEGVPAGITLGNDLATDLEMLRAKKEAATGPLRWIWEMPLRAIHHHVGKLRTIILICSPESVIQVHWFRRILDHYGGNLQNVAVKLLVKEDKGGRLIDCPVAVLKDGGWEFEDFNDLSRAVTAALRQVNTTGVPGEAGGKPVPDAEVMIDFTGGQKVTSVVAAAVTFNREVRAQYVQTNNPYNVVGYYLALSDQDSSSVSGI